MPNSPHPLADAIAADLPPDCPEEVLLEAQRKFARRVFENALARPARFVDDELARQHAEQYKCSIEESKLALLQPWMYGWIAQHGGDLWQLRMLQSAVSDIETACFQSIVHWMKETCPEEVDALLALTYETRKQWAKEMVYEIGAKSPAWEHIAPDLQDAIAAEVADAWLGGLMQRNLQYAFRLQQQKMVARMTQKALYDWLVSPEREAWEIREHYGKLQGTYAKRIQAQFSTEQWRDIQLAVPPSSTDASVDASIAEAERQAFIG